MFLLKEPSRNHRVYRLLAGKFLINCVTFYTATGRGVVRVFKGGGGVKLCQTEGTHQIVMMSNSTPCFTQCEKKAYKGGRGLTCTPLATRLNRQRYNVKFALKPVAHSGGAYPLLRSMKRRQEVLIHPPPHGMPVHFRLPPHILSSVPDNLLVPIYTPK